MNIDNSQSNEDNDDKVDENSELPKSSSDETQQIASAQGEQLMKQMGEDSTENSVKLYY